MVVVVVAVGRRRQGGGCGRVGGLPRLSAWVVTRFRKLFRAPAAAITGPRSYHASAFACDGVRGRGTSESRSERAAGGAAAGGREVRTQAFPPSSKNSVRSDDSRSSAWAHT